MGAASRLAYAGCDVTVLERNSFTGGRCSLIHHEGHRFDQGALICPGLTFLDFSTFSSPSCVNGVLSDADRKMAGRPLILLRNDRTFIAPLTTFIRRGVRGFRNDDGERRCQRCQMREELYGAFRRRGEIHAEYGWSADEKGD